MKRAVLLVCASLLLASAVAMAQETGRLTVTVRTTADRAIPAARAAGAKVMVVHWTNSGLHPTLIQDQVATTDQMGMCRVNLPPGSYDVFISASGLAPAAFHREIQAGEDIPLLATLRSAPTHLRPIQ